MDEYLHVSLWVHVTGLSGPAVLKLSSFGAKVAADLNYKYAIVHLPRHSSVVKRVHLLLSSRSSQYTRIDIYYKLQNIEYAEEIKRFSGVGVTCPTLPISY